MYLITAYFDSQTTKKIEHFIAKIAKGTGNTFMTENHVPPHLTLSSIEARDETILLPHVKRFCDNAPSGTVQMVSVGALFPYVIYMTPVLNEYLQSLSQEIYDTCKEISEIKISRFYRPMQWLPHVTLGKTLTKEQMQIAFQIMQENFVPFEAKIVRIGLSKTNPYKELL